MYSKKSGREPKKALAPLRIVLKCSWSGARLSTPDSLSLTSSLEDVVSSVASQLPPSILQQNGDHDQAAIVYLRSTFWRRGWQGTTVEHVLGDAVSGSVLFTLNLPAAAPLQVNSYLKESSHSSGSLQVKDKDMPLSEAASAVDSMDIDIMSRSEPFSDSAVPLATVPSDSSPSATQSAESKLSPEMAISQLLTSNFDADSKECAQTLLKIMDNIILKPLDPKVRSLRLSNPILHQKV